MAVCLLDFLPLNALNYNICASVALFYNLTCPGGGGVGPGGNRGGGLFCSTGGGGSRAGGILGSGGGPSPSSAINDMYCKIRKSIFDKFVYYQL